MSKCIHFGCSNVAVNCTCGGRDNCAYHHDMLQKNGRIQCTQTYSGHNPTYVSSSPLPNVNKKSAPIMTLDIKHSPSEVICGAFGCTRPVAQNKHRCDICLLTPYCSVPNCRHQSSVDGGKCRLHNCPVYGTPPTKQFSAMQVSTLTPISTMAMVPVSSMSVGPPTGINTMGQTIYPSSSHQNAHTYARTTDGKIVMLERKVLERMVILPEGYQFPWFATPHERRPIVTCSRCGQHSEHAVDGVGICCTHLR